MESKVKEEREKYMDGTKELLEAIANVRKELRFLKTTGMPKETQLECFKRLVTLYGLLNVEYLKKIADKQAA